MKKNVNLFLAFIMFFLFPLDIYAEREVRHISFIESFNLKDGMINFGGYAFFSHQDNYGVNNNGYGNLQNYIVAYTGEWDNKYVICNNESDSNCMIYKGKTVDRDMWFSRCIDRGCFQERQNYAYRRGTGSNEEAWLKFANDNNRGFINSTACHNTKTGMYDSNFGNEEISTQCIYENVEFNATIDLKKLVNKLGNENKINFKIVSINTNLVNVNKITASEVEEIFDNVKEKQESNQTIDSLAIGVSKLTMHPSACKNGSMGDDCVDRITSEFYDSGFKVKLGGFANTATYDAVDAWPKNSSGKSIKTTYNDKVYYEVGSTFNILGISHVKKAQRGYDEFYNGKSVLFDEISCFNMSRDYKESKCIGKSLSQIEYDEFVVHLDTKIMNGKVVPGDGVSTNDDMDDIDYWAVSSHLVFNGDFYIEKYKPAYENYKCNQLFPGDHLTSATFDCDSEYEITDQLNECVDNKILDSIIYIDEFESNPCFKYENGYIPIKVSTKIAINQGALFKTPAVNNSSNPIRAGKGFTIDKWNYTSLIQWAYTEWWIEGYGKEFSPYYTFLYDPDGDGNSNDYYLSGSCSANGISVDELLKDSNTFYFDDLLGEKQRTTNLNDAVYGSFDTAFKKEYLKDIYNSSNDSSQNLNDWFSKSLKFKSCDSNSNTTDCKEQDVNGKWNVRGGKIANAGRYITNGNIIKNSDDANSIGKKYENEAGGASYFVMDYSLPYSYISLTSNNEYNYGDIKYSSIDTSYEQNDFFGLGNKYFVGMKYSNNIFPFYLNEDVDPSLIDGMVWNLSGICNINVDNGLFDDNGKPLYKYRSISLSNSFPRGDVGYPINWNDWMTGSNKDNNIARLYNTYDVNDSKKYFVIISKLDGIDGATSIDDINDYNNDKFYGDITNFKDNKYSKFVLDKFNGKADNNTYCGLGFFSNNCDFIN